MRNATFWTGLTLTILGAGSFAAAATLSAATVAVFGLLLIGLGVVMRQARRAQAADAMALGVVLLGLLDALNNLGRTLSEDGLAVSQPMVTSLASAGICGLYLALWGWEHRGQRQNRDMQ